MNSKFDNETANILRDKVRIVINKKTHFWYFLGNTPISSFMDFREQVTVSCLKAAQAK